MKTEDIYNAIIPCVCGSKSFHPIIGYVWNSTEIVCARCGRTAEYKFMEDKI